MGEVGARRHVRILLLIVVVGLAVRVAWWLIAHPQPVSDYLGYRSIAERLVSTGEYTRGGVASAWRTPGYPVFLAAGMLVSHSDRWLSALNVLLSTAAVPLSWWVAVRLGMTWRTALYAAFVVALMPTLVFWAPVLGSENLQVVLMLASCAALLGGTRRDALLAGVLFGVGVLVRPETLFYLAAVPVLLAVNVRDWRTVTRRTAVVLIVAGVFIVPWYVRNQVAVGDGVGLSSTGGANFYMAHRPHGYGYIDLNNTVLAGLDEAALSRKGFALGLDEITSNPTRWLATTARGTVALYNEPQYAAYYSTRKTGPHGPFEAIVSPKVVNFARATAFIGWLVTLALAIAGACSLFRRRGRAFWALAALVGANWVCFAVVFWAMPRYRFAIEPLIGIAGGAGVAFAYANVCSLRSRYGRRGASPSSPARPRVACAP